MTSTTSTTQATTTTEATTSTTTSTSSTTTTAPTTTVASTTTAPPDGDGSPPLNSVPADEDDLDEYARIYREHLAYQNWLGLHPTIDPVVLSRVFHRDGPWWDRQREGMQTLLDNGEIRQDDIAATVLSPFPDSDPAARDVLLMAAILQRSPTLFLDASTGDVRRETGGAELLNLVVELRPDETGAWLVWDQRLED